MKGLTNSQRTQPVRQAKSVKEQNYVFPSFLADSSDEDKPAKKKSGKKRQTKSAPDPVLNNSVKPTTPVRVNETTVITDTTITSSPRNLDSLLEDTTIPESISPIAVSQTAVSTTNRRQWNSPFTGAADLGIHTLVTSSMLPTAVSTPVHKQLADTEQQLVQARMQVRDSLLEIEALKEDNKSLKVQLDIKEKEVQSWLEKDLVKENKSLKAKVDKKDKETKEMKSTKKQASKAVSDLDNAKKQITKLNEKVVELESIISALQESGPAIPSVQVNNRFDVLTEDTSQPKSYANAISTPATNTAAASTVPIHYFRSYMDRLSNFHADPIQFNGKIHKTAEHCYQYTMAVHHDNMPAANDIASAPTPGEAKRLAHMYIPNHRSTWETTKVSVMEDIIRAKADQHHTFKNELLKTGNKKLVHNMERDPEWGFGRDGKGLNLMGKILEKIRSEIQQNVTRSHTAKSPAGRQAGVRPKVKPPPQGTTTGHVPTVTPAGPGERKSREQPTTKRPGSVPPKPTLLIIGNSNARNLASEMRGQQAVDVTSICHSGAPTQYIASRGSHLKPPQQPTHVFVHTGDIDVRSPRSVMQNSMDMDNMLHMLSDTFPGSKILIDTIPEVRDPDLNLRIRDLNQFIQHQCSRNQHLTQVGSARTPLRRDRIHISKKGLAQLASEVTKVITEKHI